MSGQESPEQKTVPEEYDKMASETAGSSSNQKPIGPEPKPEEKPLTPAEFRAYNKLSETMNLYHNHFRATWTELITALRTGTRPKGQSLRQFLAMASNFCRTLEMHHNIEETYFFPILGKKMPPFAKNHKKHGEMLEHHKKIHKGLDKFSDYVEKCRDGEKDFVGAEMLELMEAFEQILWQHLEEEVQNLRAENMRKYWTLEELKMLPL